MDAWPGPADRARGTLRRTLDTLERVGVEIPDEVREGLVNWRRGSGPGATAKGFIGGASDCLDGVEKCPWPHRAKGPSTILREWWAKGYSAAARAVNTGC